MIQTAKQDLDLVSVVETAGVELNRSGTRRVGLCPFHDEKTASFYVFNDNRFKCFGCQESGDVIDFVQKMYGLSFIDALRHLGIDRGELTLEIKVEIRQRKRRAELLRQFDRWKSRYLAHLGSMINATERLKKTITPENIDLYAHLLHGLPVWEYHSEILLSGNDELKFQLFKDKEARSERR